MVPDTTQLPKTTYDIINVAPLPVNRQLTVLAMLRPLVSLKTHTPSYLGR
jgi:hypothetical protein